MADLSKTISNSLNLFGPAPSNKWNAYAWNAFRWGEGTTDLAVAVVKLIANTATLADSLTKLPIRVVTNSLEPSTDMVYEAVQNGGYYRLFPGSVVDGEDRVASTWADGSSTSPSWSQAAASSTSWSQS